MHSKFYSLREKMLLALLFLTSIASLFFFFHFKSLAFPEYNIKFEIHRQQVATDAKSFLVDMDVPHTNYQDVTVFTIDDEAKTYLERKADVDQTARLAQNDIDLWHFTTRFFKPLEKEEYTVSFLPNGRLSGYTRLVPEEKEVKSVTSNEAQVIAEEFLQSQTETTLIEWELIDVDVIERKNRIDYAFVWEKKNFVIQGESYRQKVGIIGDQIGSYHEFLKVPETWTRQYEQERSQNDLAQIVAEAISFLLFGISALLFFILRYRKNDLRFRFGSSVAIATFVIVLLAGLNSLPLVLASYPTTESWGAFLGEVGLGLIMEACLLSLLNFFIVVVGESFYRQAFPKRIALEHLLGRGLFTKEVNTSLFVGSFGGVISFGYVVLFYILGRDFGFWSPAEINYSDAFSTIIPWSYPLFIGFSAAVFEEGIFRLFGILFLLRYIKKPWIAVIITAFVWGFLHSNYPQSPWFARGIEVGIEGLLLGFLFLRFGILAAVVSHYTFNALITSVALASSASIINVFIAVSISFLPLIIAIVGLIRAAVQKGFVPKTPQLTNEHLATLTEKITATTKNTAATITSKYTPLLTKKFLWIVLFLLSVSLIAIVTLAPQITVPMSEQPVTREDAIRHAREALIAQQIVPSHYQVVANYASSPPSALEQEYLTQFADTKTVEQLYPQEIPLSLWQVRFYNVLEKESYLVHLHPGGSLYSLDYVLPENAGGANLSEKEALAIAETYLQEQQQDDVSAYKLIASQKKKRENRTDYTFTFEGKQQQIADAPLRVSLDVLGDKPSGFQKYLKLPEAWVREQEKTTTVDFLFDTALLLPLLLLIVSFVTTFFSLLKAKQIHYKQALLFSLPFVGVSLVQTVNHLPVFFASYPTTIPLTTFVLEEAIAIGIGQILSVLFFSALIALFVALWKERLGQVLPQEPEQRKAYYKDALFIGYLFPLLIAGYGIVVLFVSLKLQIISSLFFAEDLSGIDHFLPAITLVDHFTAATLSLLVGACLLLLLRRRFHSSIAVVGVIFIFLLVSEAKELLTTSQTFIPTILQLVLTAFSFVLGAFVVLRVIKANLLAYILILYTTIMIAGAWDFVSQESFFFQINGGLLFLFSLMPLIIYFVFLRRRG